MSGIGSKSHFLPPACKSPIGLFFVLGGRVGGPPAAATWSVAISPEVIPLEIWTASLNSDLEPKTRSSFRFSGILYGKFTFRMVESRREKFTETLKSPEKKKIYLIFILFFASWLSALWCPDVEIFALRFFLIQSVLTCCYSPGIFSTSVILSSSCVGNLTWFLLADKKAGLKETEQMRMRSSFPEK